MMDKELACAVEHRKEVLRAAQGGGQGIYGLDSAEVGADKRTLIVRFIGRAPGMLSPKNFVIEGGRAVRGIVVERVRWCEDGNEDDEIVLTLDRAGDFSTYTLRLVEDRDGDRRRLAGIDQFYDAVKFSFKGDCPTDLDCAATRPCPPRERIEPVIDYLAKDDASFRRLLLDRLSLIMPAWRDTHEADLGITLVELFAYAGDYLSYFQDAVATEAYIGTARQRISVRRHARLVDYAMHEGNNARAWVVVDVGDDIQISADAIGFVTSFPGAPLSGAALTWDDLRDVPANAYEVFEPIAAPSEMIRLYESHNEIHFHTWGGEQCCLSRGATSATLVDGWVREQPKTQPKNHAKPSPTQQGKKPEQEQPPTYGRKLRLQPGDVLIFEEILGPKTGMTADADRSHRQAVRLTRVEPIDDPLAPEPVETGGATRPKPLLHIEWAPEDALTFPLCISSLVPERDCALVEPVSVARGNVILVDHGRTVACEALGAAEVAPSRPGCEGRDRPGEVERTPARFRPRLEKLPLTFRAPLPIASVCSSAALPPARVMLEQDSHEALPQITLVSIRRPFTGAGTSPNRCAILCSQCGATAPYQQPNDTAAVCGACGAQIPPLCWAPRAHLLRSGPRDADFVVELDDAGHAWIRFGDGDLGRRVDAGADFYATYRVGNGPEGNVGADVITLAVFKGRQSGISVRPRNPMPAQGGTAREDVEEVRRLAPIAVRARLERAIIAEDYARIVETHPAASGDARRPRIQRAAAELRWTGSSHEVVVAIDPLGKDEPEAELLCDVERLLERYRRIGHDVRVEPARYVPLVVNMEVCVRPEYRRADVKAALLDTLGNRGFFHPDKLTFGEGIALSALIAAAQAVEGVESVRVTKLERAFDGESGALESGILPLGPLEVARLDNDPARPENGMLTLHMEGGR